MSPGVYVEDVKASIRAPLIPNQRTPSQKSFSFTSMDSKSHEVSYARLDLMSPASSLRCIVHPVQSSQLVRNFYGNAPVTKEVDPVKRPFRIERSVPEPGGPSLFRHAQNTLVSPRSWRLLPTSSGLYNALEQVKTNLRALDERLHFEDAPSFFRWISGTVQPSQLVRDFYVKAILSQELEPVERPFRIQRTAPEPRGPSLFRHAQNTLASLRSRRLLPTSSGLYDALEQVKNQLASTVDRASDARQQCAPTPRWLHENSWPSRKVLNIPLRLV
ncbi:hypothetical protein MRX96_028601 [Rhipicephalus microplus]